MRKRRLGRDAVFEESVCVNIYVNTPPHHLS